MVKSIRDLNLTEQVSYLVENVSSWIMNQRTIHRALSEPLSETAVGG